MSGLPQSSKPVGHGIFEYEFNQKIPIPSYLYAIASGDISRATIGPRSSVWTGPDELENCQKELEGDTEKFIQAAEVSTGMRGPYLIDNSLIRASIH